MKSSVPVVLVRLLRLFRPHVLRASHTPFRLERNMLQFISLLVVVVLSSSLSLSQIPNGGFELWQTDPDTNYNPVGWETTNSYPLVSVEPYSPACQGSLAMKVKTLNIGFPFPGAALLQAAYNFSEMPTRFSACLKANIMPGDRAYLIVGLARGDSIVALQDSCTFRIDSTISQFTRREFRIAVQSNLVPDSLIIIVASGLGTGQVGTELIVDELEFRTGSTSVSVSDILPGSYSLHQNYPNPFNPSTTIQYEIPKSGRVTLRITDIVGRHVATLTDADQLPGRHSLAWNGQNDEGFQVSSGAYFYHLQVGGFVQTKKLLLIR